MSLLHKLGGAAPSRVSGNAWAGVRGIYAGGYVSANNVTIDYITIASTGNATDFGDVLVDRRAMGGCAGNGRGLIAGHNAETDEIEYITIASTGNAADFGNLTLGRSSTDGVSSGTRGVFGGGNATDPSDDTMDYVTIASAGNATDFGNLTVGRLSIGGDISNGARGVFHGGHIP
jgi:hypothetical protein